MHRAGAVVRRPGARFARAAVGVRHEMLSEAIDIIAALFDTEDGRVNYRGRYFDLEQACLWDRPERRVPIGVAVSGPGSCRLAGHKADIMIAVERAHEQFRWFGLGWKVNADLPNPDGFEAATQFVTPRQVADSLACGPDVDEHVEKIKPYIDAGFTEVALVQIGAEHQEQFIAWAERELLPALRELESSREQPHAA